MDSPQLAVLALLAERPAISAEIGRQLRDLLGRSEKVAYQLVRRLLQAELVEEISGGRGRVGAMYAATDAGRARLRAWMGSALDWTDPRDDLSVRLAVASPADLPLLLRAAREQQRTLDDQLGQLAAASNSADVSVTVRAARLLQRDLQRALVVAYAAWLEDAIDTIEELIDAAGGG